MIQGSSVEAMVIRVVDGDTIRVKISEKLPNESLRLLALDTEESNPGSNKPVTPFGYAAKERAGEFFQADDRVVLEFPGTEPLETAVDRYRGNYGRLLVYVHKDGVDFQETMIREGFSPYFVKYGNSEYHHEAYRRAEREAQAVHAGVWNQLEVNGSVARNYPALSTWWQLRAGVIEEFRRARPGRDDLLDSRLDFDEIKARAGAGSERASVFTAVEKVQRVGSRSAVVRIGSHRQPFSLFLPNVEDEAGQRIVRLLENRYISGGEELPRRSYAYVTGELELYRGDPEIVVTSTDQITDSAPPAL